MSTRIRSWWITTVLLVGILGTATPSLAGVVFVSGDDADQHCAGQKCGNLYARVLKAAADSSRAGDGGILAIGVNSGLAVSSLESWNSPENNGPGLPIRYALTTSDIETVDLNAYTVVFVPTDAVGTRGGIKRDQIIALNTRKEDLREYITDKGGSLIALTENAYPESYGWLPLQLWFREQKYTWVLPTVDMLEIAPGATRTNLSHAYYHTAFDGPPGFAGLKVLARAENDGSPLILGFDSGEITDGPVCTASPRADYSVDPGQTVAFDIRAANPTLDPVQLTVQGIPEGATLQPALPLSGPGAGISTHFSWRPLPRDAGWHVPEFRAAGGTQVSNPCRVSIFVRGDEVAPILECPENIEVPAQAEEGTQVEFTLDVSDNLDPAPRVECDPASGAVFPIGTTRVSCTATDRSRNRSSCSFLVTVTDPSAQSGGVGVEVLGAAQLYPGEDSEIVVEVHNYNDYAVQGIPLCVSFSPSLAVALESPTAVLPGHSADEGAADPLGVAAADGTDALLFLSGLEAGGTQRLRFRVRPKQEEMPQERQRLVTSAHAAIMPRLDDGNAEAYWKCANAWLFWGFGKMLDRYGYDLCFSEIVEKMASTMARIVETPGDAFKFSSIFRDAIMMGSECAPYLDSFEHPMEAIWTALPHLAEAVKTASLAERIFACAGPIVEAVSWIAQQFGVCICLPSRPETRVVREGSVDISWVVHPGGTQPVASVGGDFWWDDGLVGELFSGCAGGDCGTFGEPFGGGGGSGAEGDPRDWPGHGRDFRSHPSQDDAPEDGRWACHVGPDGRSVYVWIETRDVNTDEPIVSLPDGVWEGREGRFDFRFRRVDGTPPDADLFLHARLELNVGGDIVLIEDSVRVSALTSTPSVRFTEAGQTHDQQSIRLAWDVWNLGTPLRSYALFQSANGGEGRLVAIGDSDSTALLPVGQPGVYVFTLTVEDMAGFSSSPAEAEVVVGLDEAAIVSPRTPVVGNSVLRFAVPQAGPVGMRVVDVTGRVVRTLLDRSMPAGWAEVYWDGRDDDGRSLGSGVYFVLVRAGREERSSRIVRLR